eukprot:scaffold1277_cov253-Pinguiococcus_pyrenoidosus.AAC.20
MKPPFTTLIHAGLFCVRERRRFSHLLAAYVAFSPVFSDSLPFEGLLAEACEHACRPLCRMSRATD